MITKTQLSVVMKYLKLKSFDQAIQDYILEKALYFMSKLWFEKFVLIGGTALSKFYGVPRFSKDIDVEFLEINNRNEYAEIYSAIKEEFVSEGFSIKDVGEPSKKESWFIHTFLLILPFGKAGLLIEIKNRRKLPKHEIMERNPPYPDMLPYKIKVGDLEYIFVEKIKAIFDLARYQVRDLFDVYYLARKYGLDTKTYTKDKHEEFCKIAKSMLRHWSTLEEILLIDLPRKREVLHCIGCL